MIYGQKITMKKRVLKATWALILNLVLWIVVPYYIGTLLAGRVPSSPLTIPSFVYEFGIVLTILDVGAAFFEGMAISIPFVSGAALVSALYLWLVTDGGNLRFNAAGTTIALEFQFLVYLMIVPSVWSAIKAPVAYMIWRRNPPQAALSTPITSP
jgi:hypothetical protein